MTIYTTTKTKLSAQNVQTFNAQHQALTANSTTKTLDRFLIINNATTHLIGQTSKIWEKVLYLIPVTFQ